MRTLTGFVLLGMVMAAWARPNFHLPAPERFKLSNGITVYYLQDRSLPLVGFRMLIKGAGTAAEPKDREGAADLMAELLMKGAAGKTALQIAEELDYTGASLNLSAAEEYLSISGQSLTKYWPDLLQLTGDCLLRPTFSESEFSKEVDRRIDQIKAVKDEPSSAVRPYFRKAYFGDHPFGHLAMGTESSLRAIKVKDVTALYRNVLQPNQAILAVVGDFEPSELRALLEKNFANWKKRAAAGPVPALPGLPVPRGKKCLLIDKADASQAYFVLGVPGIAMGDERTAAAQVMNTLFGGRFTSWLNNELRVKRGLTYGARSSLESWKLGGLFTVSSYTKNDKIGEMLRTSFELLDKARSDGFTDNEVTSSRNYVLGQFPPRFETLMSKARAYTDLVFYGLPFEYYGDYLAKVGTSTVATVNRESQELMPRDEYVLVVVGKADEIREQLKPFGAFVERSIVAEGF